MKPDVIENADHDTHGRGWVIARYGLRRFKWSFPARTEQEWMFWSQLVLDALRR